jgi:hypothetical protein
MVPINDLPPPPTSGKGIDDLPPPPKNYSPPKELTGWAKAADTAEDMVPVMAIGKKLKHMIQDDPAAAEAGLEHFGNQAALGYLPHLAAKAEPITDRAYNLVTGEHTKEAPWSQLYSNDENYVKARDENIAHLKHESQESPMASLAGDIGGGIVAGAAMSGAAPINAAKWTGRALQAARAGALTGAAYNPGDTEGEVNTTQLRDRGKNAAVSAALAVPLQMGADAVSKGAGYLADKAGTSPSGSLSRLLARLSVRSCRTWTT